MIVDLHGPDMSDLRLKPQNSVCLLVIYVPPDFIKVHHNCCVSLLVHLDIAIYKAITIYPGPVSSVAS
jgi:hypothetical protein